MKVSIILFAFTALFVLSCNKTVVDYNKDFEGQWRSEKQIASGSTDSVQSEIVIDGDDGIYRYTCSSVCAANLCECAVMHSGKAVVNSNKTYMKIGTSGSYPLSIDEEPSIETATGKWTMVIHGLRYYKQ